MKKICQILSLCLAPLLIFSSCKASFDTKAYVAAVIEATYKGDFTNYLKMVRTTPEQAEEMYENHYKSQADTFATRYSIKKLSDEKRKIIEDLYQYLYKQIHYTVTGNEKTNGNASLVNVEVQPITLFKDCAKAIGDYTNQFNQNTLSGTYLNLSEEEFEDAYTQGILDILYSAGKQSIPYGDPKSLSMKVIHHKESNTYDIDPNDFGQFEKAVIVYA